MNNQKKTRILIVEDESIVAADIEDGLKRDGYDIVGIAVEGLQAIRLIEQELPDLVLMDIRLQGKMTGIEVAQEIGSRFFIPVVYITAHSDEATLQQAKLTRPFGYLLKPFGQRELRATIEMALYKAASEKRLMESERWNRLIIESAYHAFIAMDSAGLITDWNPQAEKCFGWAKEEVLGRKLAETVIPLKFRQAHFAGLARFLKTGEGRVLSKVLELSALHRQGHEFPAEVTIQTAEVSGKPQFFAFIRDISEKKRFDALVRRKEELERSNAELERFAHITSHDLQEPLRTMTMYSELLVKQLKGKMNAEQKQFAQHVIGSASRMQQLIQDLLTFSRVSPKEEEVFELVESEAALKNALSDLRVLIEGNGAQVLYDELPVVKSKILHVSQIFLNLISNAIKFRSAAPPLIKITAKREEPFWVFSVQDNGIGFEQKYAEQIFEMFKRLYPNDVFPGTGMGLAICRKIVALHGGRIWAESEVGKGATFHFSLPTG